MSASNPEDQLTTKVEEYRNKDGKAMVVTTVSKLVTKTVRIPKGVYERRQLPKFGRCKGQAAGPEKTVTTISNDMFELRCTAPRREETVEKSEIDRIAEAKTSTIFCKNCGESGHFTLKCPKRREIDAKGDKREGGDSNDRSNEPVEYTVKLSNLPDDMTDYALRRLVNGACQEIRINEPDRIFLAKDRVTNVCKGFSFISFPVKESAERLVDRLDSHGYDNLILQAELTDSRNDRPRRFNDDAPVGDTRGEKDFSLGGGGARGDRPWRR